MSGNPDTWLDVGDGCRIPLSALRFSFSRASGPGGQHVNKVNTRVTLSFDLAQAPWLDQDQKRRVLARLGNRISRQGILKITAREHRSQRENRQEALRRFQHLLRAALHRDKVRRRTRIPARVREERLRAKKKRARVKQWRSRRIRPDQD